MSYNSKFNKIVQKTKMPPPPSPLANYIPFRIVGNLIYLSGTTSFWGSDIKFKGRLGDNVSVKEGQQAARLTGLNLLYTVQDALGTLDKVKNIVFIKGMVNCTPDFEDQSDVINGCSALMVEIFGQTHGKHARSATGHVSLAFGISVEVEMIVEMEG
jgi:enamine deaminase RidA (YjgF/YER057c/UK114 family)